MNYRNTLAVLTAALLLGFGSIATAATDEEAARFAEEKALQTQLEAEYKKAIAVAERERHAADASIQKAREQLHQVSEQRKEHAKDNAEAHAAQQAEIEKMHKELSHARRQLQETSREVARVNREVSRARSIRHVSSYAFSTSDRPVIGVILGEADDVGVKVLGVSPDGPSERAGIKRGDVIVAVGGRVLASVDESDDAREGLKLVMYDIKADEPVVISVERAEQTLDLTVVPEIREPISRQFVTRFATAPVSPSAPASVISVERIVVPEIDTEGLSQQIEQIRVEIDERRALMDERLVVPVDGEYEFEFHDLSEMGNDALYDANVWFGLPMAQGLQLAEIGPGLGEYFKTDRGVLVLKAKSDNELQLESGDVILQVGDTEVNSPAEFMRALRRFESGDELVLDIKRKRKDRTLKTVMPESRTSFFKLHDGESHRYEIITQSN